VAPIREERLETLRTGRVALLGDTRAAELEEIWYLLHGYRQSASRFLTRFQSIASARRLLVAPEGLSRFYVKRGGGEGRPDAVGASWMTSEDREWEIRDYVRYLDRVALQVEGDRVDRTVVGFSQGAHTAARWAALGHVTPNRLILWGAGLPRDLVSGRLPHDRASEAVSRLRETRVILVRGAEDPWRNGEEERSDEEWLRDAGIAYEIHEHPHGHEIVPEVLATLADA
jgi:predicted esterase